jgi:hypothetical protein
VGYASKSGRARTSITSPRAFGVCERCGMWFNHHKLRWQFEWRGAALMNIRRLVCNACYDRPQQQLRAIVIPADPLPIRNPRPEPFEEEEA